MWHRVGESGIELGGGAASSSINFIVRGEERESKKVLVFGGDVLGTSLS